MKERRRCNRCGCEGNAVSGSEYCFQHGSGEIARQRAVSRAGRKPREKGWSRTAEVERLTRKLNAREIERLREIIVWCMERMTLPLDQRLGDLEMLLAARTIEAQATTVRSIGSADQKGDKG